MRVMKFGGASLRDGPAIRRSADLVERAARADRVLLVVSAQEGVTARLQRSISEAVRGNLEPWDGLRVRHRSTLSSLGLEGDLLDRHLTELRAILEELVATRRADRRMRDYVLSFGERMSARVVAAVLRQRGVPATPLDAFDLGLTTASRQGAGALLHAPASGLRRTLEAVPGIPVVTGFLALDAAGHLTTLGPNGSDLTAVWFGEAVGAREVVLWKTVDGFMTADPEVVPTARRIPELGRSEAIELALHGAEVLHAGALEPAARGGIVVRVANVEKAEAPGSRIGEETPRAGPLGLAHRSPLVLYRETLSLGYEHDAQLARLFAQLADCGLEPHRAAITGRDVTLLLDDDEGTAGLVASRAPEATVEGGLASFAVVGRDVGQDAALAARVRELAGDIRLEVAPGGESPSSLAWITPAATLPKLLGRLHAALFGIASDRGEDAREVRVDEILPHPRRSQGHLSRGVGS